MRLGALALALLTATAAAEPPVAADAPRMVAVPGGYFLNDAGYQRLEAETTRLQLAERALKARVAELEAVPRGVQLEALGTVAGLALVAGVVLGVWARGAVTSR